MCLPLGDYYLLHRKFCQKQNEHDRKEILTNLVKNVRRDRSSKNVKHKSAPSSFKWYNYDPKKDKYCMVRSETGGGVHSKSIPLSEDLQEITTKLTNFFFPGGVNSKDEHLDYFEWSVADQQLNEIKDPIDTENSVKFTVENFLKMKSWPKPVFVLKTKKLSSQQFILRKYHNNRKNKVDDSDSSGSDFEIPKKKPKDQRIQKTQLKEATPPTPPSLLNNLNCPSSSQPQQPPASIPGGSSEIRLQQDLEYLDSLKQDQLKEMVSFPKL